MTELADRQRAGRLMHDARRLALSLIDEGFTPAQIALRTYPFVEYAAGLTPKEYGAAEAARVLGRFRETRSQLAAVRAD